MSFISVFSKVQFTKQKDIGMSQKESSLLDLIIFAFNEDEEKAEVIKPEGGPEDCIEEAMDSCPTECITWEE